MKTILIYLCLTFFLIHIPLCAEPFRRHGPFISKHEDNNVELNIGVEGGLFRGETLYQIGGEVKTEDFIGETFFPISELVFPLDVNILGFNIEWIYKYLQWKLYSDNHYNVLGWDLSTVIHRANVEGLYFHPLQSSAYYFYPVGILE